MTFLNVSKTLLSLSYYTNSIGDWCTWAHSWVEYMLTYSFMKLIVSTFLVYKVKKCLLKSGKVSSSDGPSMPSGWSACARYTGIRSPPSGHRQPLCWATTAHNVGNECPNVGIIFGQYSFDSLRYSAYPRRPRRVCHGLMTHPLFIFTQLLDDFLKLLNIQ